VLDIYFANVEKGTRPGIDEISRALENEISRYNKAFIVIDAADECSEGTLTTVLRYLNKPTISSHGYIAFFSHRRASWLR
jgi:hypothetical protein